MVKHVWKRKVYLYLYPTIICTPATHLTAVAETPSHSTTQVICDKLHCFK